MSALPNFLLLGAPKSGTTALYHWLERHPDIHLSSPKEPFYFEDEYDRGPEYYWDTYFAPGWAGQRLVGEARTAHLYLPYVTERIQKTLPNAKLVAILRHPVERAHSHWWMLRCNGREPLSFRESLRQIERSIAEGESFDDPGIEQRWAKNLVPPNAVTNLPDIVVRAYLEAGLYAKHIERWLHYVPRSRLLILLHDDLVRTPLETMRQLFSFLDLDPAEVRSTPAPENVALTNFSRPLFLMSRRLRLDRVLPRRLLALGRTTLSKFGSRPQMSREARDWLHRYYEPHNRRLEQLLDRDLSHWDR